MLAGITRVVYDANALSTEVVSPPSTQHSSAPLPNAVKRFLPAVPGKIPLSLLHKKLIVLPEWPAGPGRVLRVFEISGYRT